MITAGELDDDGVIEVQVIPQDDTWAETATTFTETATSYASSVDDFSKLLKDVEESKPKSLKWFRLRTALYVAVALLVVSSPVAFVLLPFAFGGVVSCDASSCDISILSLAAKEFVLIVGLWFLYCKNTRYSLPRFLDVKVALSLFGVVCLSCYWIFYAFRVFRRFERRTEIHLAYATSLVDTLLFVHYLSLVLLYVCRREKKFLLKVVRNKDGASRCYSVGSMSLQSCAKDILERYLCDFPEFNPYRCPPSTKSQATAKRLAELKFYDLDGSVTDSNSRTKAAIAINARRRLAGRNEKFYEETENERRVKRRRARAMATVDEALTHVRRVLKSEELSKEEGAPMNADEAAQVIFPAMARPLQKYLKTTRQHHIFEMDDVLKHLADSINYDMNPQAFIELYSSPQPAGLFANDPVQTWSLVSSEPPTKVIDNGCVFQLKHGDRFSLIVSVKALPHIDLREEACLNDSGQFTLKISSETSV